MNLADHLKARYALGQLGLPSALVLTALTLTAFSGYVKATGGVLSAGAIPNTDITGLGTMSTQNATAVAITGGSIIATALRLSESNPYIEVNDTGTGNPGFKYLDALIEKWRTDWVRSTGHLRFLAGVATNVMSLVPGGRVLINTATDDGVNVLQVAGQTRLNGTLTVAVTSGVALLMGSTSAVGAYATWTTNGVAVADFGSADQTYSGGSAADFGITSRGGNLVLGQNTSPAITIGPTSITLVGRSLALPDAQNLFWGTAACSISGNDTADTMGFYTNGVLRLTLSDTGATVPAITVTGVFTATGGVGLGDAQNLYWGTTQCAISGNDVADTMSFYTNNVLQFKVHAGSVDVTGTLAVLGASATVGIGGTGAATAFLRANGGSASGGGGYAVFQRNSIDRCFVGCDSSIAGNNTNHLALFGTDNVRLYADNVLATEWTSATAAFTGTASFVGDVALITGITLTSNGDLYARVVRSTISCLGDQGDGTGFQVRVRGAGVEGLDISNLGFNVTYAIIGALGIRSTTDIATVNPAGGDGPVWTLGIAATVTPTAPDRTIRIKVAGTDYYLHAKTTND